MPQKLFRSPLSLLNLCLLLSFSLLACLWLSIKINLAQTLNPSLSLFSYIDIIRSHASLDLALCLLFAWNFKLGLLANNTLKILSTVLALLLYVLLVFYFLKLTGLYAYTHDATPYSMIVYGTYLLGLPFAGEALSFIGYIFLPSTLVLSLLILFFIQIKKLSEPQKKQIACYYHTSFMLIITFVVVSLIPPRQNDLPVSLAYHPYIYSAFASQTLEKTQAETTTSQAKKNEPNKKIITTKKNIVIVVLESFGYSTLQAHITPTLFDLQKNSFVFDHAFAVIPHTSKALVTIHCGDIPFLSPYLLESNLGVASDCLASTLAKQNYQSVFFQSVTKHFENREALVKQLGFNEFMPLEKMDTKDFEAVNYFGYEDDIMLPTSEAWLLARNSQQPFLATYLTGTSHHNYDTPSNFPIKNYVSQKNKNRYLNAARYVDRFVAKLLAQYKKLGLYENTIFVFVGDHGEGFGEHRPLMHNNNLYNSGIHIPLIIHEGTSQHTPMHIKQLTSQSEIAHLLENLLTNTSLSLTTEKKFIVSSCWYPDYCYSLITQHGELRYKYLLDVANNTQELFELSSDPQERVNLYQQQRAFSEQLRKELLETINTHKIVYETYYKNTYPNYLDLKEYSFSPFQTVEH